MRLLTLCFALAACTVAAGTVGTADPAAAATPLPERLAHVGRSRLVVVVQAAGTNTRDATVEAWKKDTAGTWRRFLDPRDANVGAAGLVPADERIQGDLRTPMGTFTLARAFGTRADPGTGLPYKRLDGNDYWAGDQADPATYNLFQHRHPRTAAWRTSESERLASYTPAYHYAVNIGFNLPRGRYVARNGERQARTPADVRRGAAIFLHAYGTGGAAGATAGCVALQEEALAGVLRRLDPALRPKIVIGTTENITRV